MSRSHDLTGKVAVVTGAASGIGLATVRQLASVGARVAIVDRDEPAATRAASDLRASGAEAYPFHADLSDLNAVAAIVPATLARFGRIDILVNCAGQMFPDDSVLKITDATWNLAHAVNLRAPAFLIQHVGRHMIDRGGGGRIVNVSSSSAFRALESPYAYASAKAGVLGMTRVAAAELGRHDINVNVVVPGATYTPMVTGRMTREEFDRKVQPGASPLGTLLGRGSEPEDVAAVIVFLCVPASRQITAQAIHISAGAVV